MKEKQGGAPQVDEGFTSVTASSPGTRLKRLRGRKGSDGLSWCRIVHKME